MFKKIVIAVCMVLMVAMAGCSQKKPSEIRTYRELLNYSISAMKAYKGAPSEYVSILKDYSIALGDTIDEDIEKGEVFTNLSDTNVIEDMVDALWVYEENMDEEKLEAFEKKYDNFDFDAFSETLKKALINYAR